MKKNSQQLKNRRKLPQLDKDHVYNPTIHIMLIGKILYFYPKTENKAKIDTHS